MITKLTKEQEALGTPQVTIKVKTKKDCILWPGVKDKHGYGVVKVAGKTKRAHRVKLEIKIKRRLRRDELALHLCHTPACVNPDHLIVGTAKENRKHYRERKQSLADVYLDGWRSLYE